MPEVRLPRSRNTSAAMRLWDALELWESERGGQLQEFERSRYEELLAVLPSPAAPNATPLGLEEAIEPRA